MAKIFEGEDPVIFGDGTQSRDFTYVKDVVKANILASKSKKAAGKVMNVASGNPIDLNELTKIMIEASGQKDINIQHGPERKGDIKHSYGDMSRAKELIGFEATYDAVSGFKKYLKYYRDKFYPDHGLNLD